MLLGTSSEQIISNMDVKRSSSCCSLDSSGAELSLQSHKNTNDLPLKCQNATIANRGIIYCYF